MLVETNLSLRRSEMDMTTTLRCRCCLATAAGGHRSIDEVPAMYRQQLVKLRDMLQMFVGVDDKVNPIDRHKEFVHKLKCLYRPRQDARQPNHICDLCVHHLTSAHAFYRQCLHAQSIVFQPPSIARIPTPPQLLTDSSASVNNIATVRQIRPKPPATVGYETVAAAATTTSLFRCRQCHDSRFASKHELAHHRRIHHLNADTSRFCSACSVQFYTAETYRRHCKLHADNICMFCNIGFATAADVDEHIGVQHASSRNPSASEGGRFTCYQCSGAFSTRRALLRHGRRMHGAAAAAGAGAVTAVQYLCGVCLRATFGQRSALRAHLVDCQPTAAAATTASVDDGAIVDHRLDAAAASAALNFGGLDDDMPVEFLNYSLLGGEDWDDDCCNFDVNYMDGMVEEFLDDAFQLPTGMNDFGLSVADDDGAPIRGGSGDSSEAEHTAGRNQRNGALKHSYQCPRCAESTAPLPFATKHELYVHLAHEHKEPVLVCHLCGSGFTSTLALAEHRRMEHRVTVKRAADGGSAEPINEAGQLPAGPRDSVAETAANVPLLCSLCDKSFSTVGGLKCHLLTHTGARGANSTVAKPHRCSYCPRTFSSAISLAAHMRASHSTAPAMHHCEHCDRRFATGYQMQRHTAAAHGGQRGHVCAVCGKAYTQRSHLRHHEWTHSGAKAFACALCERTFTGRPALRRHVQLVHDGEPVLG